MEILLSPRFVMVANDEAVFLMDRSTGEKIWPEDVFEPYPNWQFRPAAEHVLKMARSAMLKPEQRAIVEKFCDGHRSRNAPQDSPPSPPSIRRIGP